MDPNTVHWIWILIQDFGPNWIRIHGYVIHFEYDVFKQALCQLGLRMVNFCLQHYTFCLLFILFSTLWIRIWIRIRNTDPEPQSSWIRIKFGSGSTTLLLFFNERLAEIIIFFVSPSWFQCYCRCGSIGGDWGEADEDGRLQPDQSDWQGRLRGGPARQAQVHQKGRYTLFNTILRSGNGGTGKQ